MEFGYFTMPSHPPERSLKAGFDWDLAVLRRLDELGFSEAWIGEHHTAPWEPNPAPDLLIAQALLQTARIRLAPGGFLLPYHHPAELANRLSMLDHIAGGRLNFGVAASSLPSDWAMFHVDGHAGANREMTREALDIILRLWTDDEPFTMHGKYWSVSKPQPMDGMFKPHLKPLQRPHPPIGIAGLSPNSDTLRLAGERGYLPMSLNLNPAYLAGHWQAVEAGAASAGREAQRADWRTVREVFVADTDSDAWRLAVHGDMGRMMRDYGLRLNRAASLFKYMKHDAQVPDSDVTVEYCARHNWVIGSPSTVATRLEEIYHQVGGFGTLLVMGFDYADAPEPWMRSLELLAKEVKPRLAHLAG
jgi:alkanesulfonate monooxygenase SsuD/methylene tetrahydromethanopterin reductase-like flavin-dependent oxidoreductase (luciferase family)